MYCFLKMACICATSNGGRCRKEVVGHNRCSLHPQNEQIGPADVVLLKFRLNRKAVQNFEALGACLETRSNEEALEKKHAEHAGMHGRKATRYRDVSDSGVPVFGKDGLMVATASSLREELNNMGYLVHQVHMYRKENDTKSGMATLVVEFREGQPELQVYQEIITAIDQLSAHTFEHCHVWSNPPNEHDLRIDTVNFAHKLPDVPPQYYLLFYGGLWDGEKIS